MEQVKSPQVLVKMLVKGLVKVALLQQQMTHGDAVLPMTARRAMAALSATVEVD